MRVLDLTTDCLLLVSVPPGSQVRHCQTGPAVMHSGCPKQPPSYFTFRVFREILRGRRYSYVIFPPIHLNWTIANNPVRKLVKRMLSWIMRHPALAHSLLRLIFGRKTRFAITDYSDMFEPSQFALQCIRPEHYFMLNVPRVLVGKQIGPRNTMIHYLPTVIQDELIDSLTKQHPNHREYDVFIAGTYHNSLREMQREAAQILAKRGYKVFELKEKSFEKFSAGILNSKLCFAAKGLSYHCFRPLEAAAAGAAPVWHGAEHDTYHDYVHGENCFLYDPQSTAVEIADFVETMLQNPARILQVIVGARKLLLDQHRGSTLARHLWRILETTPP